MSSIDKIFAEVLKDIIPEKEELALINNIVEILKELLEKKAKQLDLEFTIIEPQGSTGIKQTLLITAIS